MIVYIVVKADPLTGFETEIAGVFSNEAEAQYQVNELMDNQYVGKVWVEEHEVTE